MRRSRWAVSITLIGAGLLAIVSPAAGGPAGEPLGRVESTAHASVVTEILALVSRWLEEGPLQSFTSSTGRAEDGEGQFGASSDSDPEDGGATTQGGRTMDPDG